MKILTIEEIIQCVNGKSNITNGNKILVKGVSTDTREDLKNAEMLSFNDFINSKALSFA